MKKLKYISLGMIILTFAACAITTWIFSVKNNGTSSRQISILTENIYDEVYLAIYKPLLVSQIMVSDSFLKEKLLQEENYAPEEIENYISDYLTVFQNKMGYSSAYVISEKTHRYYTGKGVKKTVDYQTTPYDIWYQLFVNSKKDYHLDIDRDQQNAFRWTLFMDMQIKTDDGKNLGVTGVGVVLTDIQALLEKLEAQYNVKINLIDTEGLVQIDTYTQNIRNAYILEALSDNAVANEFTFSRRSANGYRATRFIPEFDWYIVIQGTNPRNFTITRIILTMAILCALLLIIYALIMRNIVVRYKKENAFDVLEDPLTGLPNRNYLREAYGEAGVFNTTRYKTIAVFDVDNFMTVSEQQDGEQVLCDLVDLAQEFFAWKGMLLRWGGDDFVALLEMEMHDAELSFIEFCKIAETSLKITLSVGISPVNIADTIKENYYHAVQKCYAMKADGGNGVRL